MPKSKKLPELTIQEIGKKDHQLKQLKYNEI